MQSQYLKKLPLPRRAGLTQNLVSLKSKYSIVICGLDDGWMHLFNLWPPFTYIHIYYVHHSHFMGAIHLFNFFY